MSEVMRVLGPGGVIVATIWATPGHNPYIDGQLDLLAALEPSLVQSVQRSTPPNADELLRALASSSGFADIDITLLEHWVDIADFGPWFLAQTAGTPWAPALDRLTDAARGDLVSAMKTKMEQYVEPDGGHCVPFRSYRLEAHR